MVNTAGLVARRFNTVSLIKITLALYIAAAPAYSYAIDPISGAWTANTIASAALGGSSSGVAGLGAAVDAAVGAGAAVGTAAIAAAAIAGVGIASYCAASYFQGTNSCGVGGSLAAPLSAANIRLDPATGDLVRDGVQYFAIIGTSYTCHSSSINGSLPCIQKAIEAKFTSYNIKLVPNNTANCNPPNQPSFIGCSSVDLYRSPKAATTPAWDFFDRQTISAWVLPPTVADPADVGAAVGADPRGRAAAAAAMASSGIGAADAAAAAATASPNTAEGDCAAKGMKSGTFQGATFCVGDASASNTGTGDLGGEVGDTGTGTGTGTGAENPPASPPATETPAFCGWAVTLCTWLDWTKTDPVAKTQAETKVDIKDRQTTDIPNLPVGINTTRISWAQQCPSPITANFNLMGQSVDWQYKFDTVCDFAAKFRPYVIGLSYLTAAYIVMGLNRTRSE